MKGVLITMFVVLIVSVGMMAEKSGEGMLCFIDQSKNSAILADKLFRSSLHVYRYTYP